MTHVACKIQVNIKISKFSKIYIQLSIFSNMMFWNMKNDDSIGEFHASQKFQPGWNFKGAKTWGF